MNFIVLKNNMVSNIIVAETKEIAESITGDECVELSSETEYGFGWIYDAASNLFIDPATIEAEEVSNTEPDA